MRTVLFAIGLAVLAVACGGSAGQGAARPADVDGDPYNGEVDPDERPDPADLEDPEMSATATWREDEIEVTVKSDDLPDGAMVSAWAVDHDDLSTSAPLDSAETDNVHTSIEDGKASITLDAADFAGDAAVLSVDFIPSFDEQPQVVRGRYWPNQGAAVERLVRR
jgi:hypothetical protein